MKFSQDDRRPSMLSRPLVRLALLALILLAWGIRLYRLDVQSLWYDEGVTATLAQRSLGELTAWTAHDIQPPLYYYGVWGWGQLAGWSAWSVRFVSVWWGVLTVPLLAVLAQRLTRQCTAAVVAALLAATHPLLVYYSQEARMYTMLVTLGILAGYQLLRCRANPGWRQWALYLLVATPAVYTHYFAFFLLLALGLAFLIDRLSGQSLATALRDRRLHAFLLTHLLLSLIYLAWIGALVGQLTSDASYWQGQLKVWEALRSVALRFTSGETVLEATALSRLLIYGLLTLGALVVIAWQARRRLSLSKAPYAQADARWLLLYLLCWFIIPLGCVLTLAAFVPKFNARYVLVALPGLLLLWSAGAAFLVQRTTDVTRSLSSQLRQGLRVGVALLSVGLMVWGFANANWHWFTDAAFTKDQWRELASYVREQIAPDEAVILVSGHAWPIWDYYAPDLPAIHLPDLQILDVNAVLDFANTGATLRNALQGKRGVWLVNWQDEVVDPNGVTPRQLLLAAQEAPLKNEFWHLRLRHFVNLEPNAIGTTPPIAAQLDANFGDQLHLRGYTATREGDLLLFWQLGKTPPAQLPDLHINLLTKTADGFFYTDPPDQRPADYTFPINRWQPGQTVMGRLPAAVWAGPGAAPGAYRVQIGVHDPAGDPMGLDLLDPKGSRLGKFVTASVQLTQTTTAEEPPGAIDDTEIMANLRLAFTFDPVTAEPGQTVGVTLYWYLEKEFRGTPELTLQWRTAKEAPALVSTTLPLTTTAPMGTWPVEYWLRQVLAVQAPATLPPGDYLFDVLAKGRDNPARRPITIRPSSRQFTPPPLAVAQAYDFGATAAPATQQVRLLGWQQPIPETVRASQPITLALVWQAAAAATPAADYSVTLQLLGPDGRPVAQIDQSLPGGSTTWAAGQVETQPLTLTVPATAGRYPLILALYRIAPDGFPRLVTSTGADFIELGEITVTP